MAVVHLVGRRLVEIDPSCDQEGFVRLGEGYPIGCFYVGGGYHYSIDDSEGGLTVVEDLL